MDSIFLKARQSTGFRFALLIAFIFCSFSSHAEINLSGIYSGLQFATSSSQFESPTTTASASRGHLKIKLGKQLNDWAAAEGQLGATTNSSSSDGLVSYGAYLRIGREFDQYKLYGLLGFSGIEDLDDASNLSESSGSYGVGLEVFGSRNLAITFEYLHLIDTSVNGGDLTFDTLGIGFTYYFFEETSIFEKNRNKIRSIRY